jgi:hypothetical protein
LRELDAACAQAIIGFSAILDGKHERWHGSSRNHGMERVRGRFIHNRRLRLE